jgi:hypothetical protein
MMFTGPAIYKCVPFFSPSAFSLYIYLSTLPFPFYLCSVFLFFNNLSSFFSSLFLSFRSFSPMMLSDIAQEEGKKLSLENGSKRQKWNEKFHEKKKYAFIRKLWLDILDIFYRNVYFTNDAIIIIGVEFHSEFAKSLRHFGIQFKGSVSPVKNSKVLGMLFLTVSFICTGS